jgi:hypothetical protein
MLSDRRLDTRVEDVLHLMINSVAHLVWRPVVGEALRRGRVEALSNYLKLFPQLKHLGKGASCPIIIVGSKCRCYVALEPCIKDPSVGLVEASLIGREVRTSVTKL